MTAVRTGLERLALGDEDAVRLVRGRRVGLVAHPASCTRSFVHARTVLEGVGAHVCALFGPEHGFGGEAQDMVAVGSQSTDVPIHTLYGSSFDSLSPSREALDGLDALVVDLQDVGARYYTFVWTAALCLRAAAAAGVQTIVLDRPNPLGGIVVEGEPQQPGFLSFVGLYPIPVRHGKTLGEIVAMVREIEAISPDALTVVPMQGWSREMLFPQTGLPWILPSPNMPTFDTALVYPGGCLLEGTLLSEGRGTTRPFEIWGHPELDGSALARRFASRGHAGIVLRPLSFEPRFQKHAGRICGGVQAHVTDSRIARTYAAYRDMITIARELLGGDFAWRTEPYEFVSEVPAIDLLTGSAAFREQVDSGARLE